MGGEFRFAIGDLVRHKASISTRMDTRPSYMSRTLGYIIIGRVIDECSGGTQLFYRCRGVVTAGDNTGAADEVARMFLEFEMEQA